MVTAKDITLKPIPGNIANKVIKRLHYSGKVVNNSQLHIGVFLGGILHGAMQFGPSLDKRNIQGLVAGTKWHEFLELNRMAFDDTLPRNSESRAIAIAMRMIKKYAPQVKWVVSFADATQCGDGTIYRASGFVLTGIKVNSGLLLMPDGEVVHKISFEDSTGATNSKKKYGKRQGISVNKFAKEIGATPVEGFQLRYIYFIDPEYRERLTVPEIPFERIKEMGAAMYKGRKM